MNAIANATSQVIDNQAIAMVGTIANDNLVSDLLSGLSLVEQPVRSLSIMEQDILNTLDFELDVELEVAPAPVVTAEPELITAGIDEIKPKAAPKRASRKKAAVEPVEAAVEPANAAAVVALVEPEPVPEEVVAAPEPEPTPEPQKREPQPRMTFAKKSEKIAHKLGDKARDYLVLDIKDEELSDEELSAKQAELLKFIDTQLAVKVGEKAVMLFGFLRHGGKLNEIMRRTFTVLLRDGYLTSGPKGNLMTNFEAKPYSPGTAASQSNQMFALFPLLKICTGKAVGGRMEINHDSTILAKMKEELGL